MPTATATKPAKFRTPVRDLRVVRVPRRRKLAEDGSQFFTDGHTITFDGFEYETADPNEIDFLRERMRLSPSGSTNIVEVTDAEMAPDSGPALDAIAKAAVEADEETLAGILDEERERFKRPDVVRAAEGALRALGK